MTELRPKRVGVIIATAPTILYYLGVFLIVESDSRKRGTRNVLIAALSPRELPRKYWYHLASLVAIIFFMAALDMSAITAVFWSILVGIVVSSLRPETALRPRRLVQALALGTPGVRGVAADGGGRRHRGRHPGVRHLEAQAGLQQLLVGRLRIVEAK